MVKYSSHRVTFARGYWIFFLLSFACSHEVVEKPLIFFGKVKGHIVLHGDQSADLHASVTLIGGAEPVTIMTDEAGAFIFDNVSTGNYRVVAVKEGFDSYETSTFSFVGGKEPYYVTPLVLSAMSTTSAGDLALEFVPEESGVPLLDRDFLIQAVVNHTLENPGRTSWTQIVVFFNNIPDVSADNHLESLWFSADDVSGSVYSWRAYLNPEFFPPGSTVYAVAHGFARGEYDYEKLRWQYYGLSVPSNVATVQVP